MSFTLKKILEHWVDSIGIKDSIEIVPVGLSKIADLPFNVEAFCREMDEHITQLEVEARYPVCPTCGSCGVDQCCPAQNCLYPGIKAETVKQAQDLAEEAMDELEAVREQRNNAIQVLKSLGWSEEALINSKIIDEGVHQCKGCDATHSIHPEMECSCCLKRR